MIRQAVSIMSELRADGEQQDMFIEGYFSVFNKRTQLWPGAFEKVDPAAFNESLSNDIRALTNHDTMFVLGRNKSGTLELKTDARGLWGRIKINPNDTDAVNLYERVKRGDVDQCSFGFNIIEESTEFLDDGSIEWTLKKVDLHEVSVCTFPAYQDTAVTARQADYEVEKERLLAARKNELRGKLSNVKATHA